MGISVLAVLVRQLVADISCPTPAPVLTGGALGVGWHLAPAGVRQQPGRHPLHLMGLCACAVLGKWALSSASPLIAPDVGRLGGRAGSLHQCRLDGVSCPVLVFKCAVIFFKHTLIIS